MILNLLLFFSEEKVLPGIVFLFFFGYVTVASVYYLSED